MDWPRYYKELIKAKEEYDETINVANGILYETKINAWKVYLERIRKANIIFCDVSKEDNL